jgi:hypothetical protein
LAGSKNHFYVRYEEEGGNHLNIDATSRGMCTPSDREYEQGVFAATEEEKKAYNWGKPLRNSECLGHFLITRSACLRNQKRFKEEAEAFAEASRYLSQQPLMIRHLDHDQGRAVRDYSIGRWDELWDDVDRLVISPEMESEKVYFENRKQQVHYFMNSSTNLFAIERAINDLKGELLEYQAQIALSRDSSMKLFAQQQVILKVTTKSGCKVRVPSECLPPPLDRGIIPPAYLNRVSLLGVADSESILAEFWKHYGEIGAPLMEPVLRVRYTQDRTELSKPVVLPLTLQPRRK